LVWVDGRHPLPARIVNLTEKPDSRVGLLPLTCSQHESCVDTVRPNAVEGDVWCMLGVDARKEINLA
jgi:hypothetical protein